MIEQAANEVRSRRAEQKQDRREAILTVASRSFLEHGYAGTTMSGVAATLGGSKGTLWNYFPSKEELFSAVIDHETAAFRARLSTILDPCGDLRETLLRFCTRLLERMTSPKAIALYRLVIAEAGRFPEMGRIFYDRAPRLTYGILGDFLEGAMERGQLTRDDPLAAARFLITLCMSGCHLQMLMGLLDEPSPEQVEADVERALDLFLSARTPAVQG